MTKHRRTKRRSRTQRGAGFFDFINPFSKTSDTLPGIEEPNMISSTITSVTDATKNAVAGTENYLEGAKNQSSSWVEGLKNKSSGMFSGIFSSSDNVPVINTNVPYSNSSYGGRRRKTMKGGLGLTEYATPVTGMKVAEPTSWQFYANGTNQFSVKGGSIRRKNRVRKTRIRKTRIRKTRRIKKNNNK